jgi:hypothetical protein
METIIWFNLHGDQEISPRLGFREDDRFDNRGNPSPDLINVCCQQVYDIAWEAEKEMYKRWKAWDKADRNPHFWEFQAFYDKRKIEPPFLEHPDFFYIVDVAREKIHNFYLKHLNRFADEWELRAAFRQCQIDPNFHYDYSLQHGTEEYKKKNYDERCRKDAFDFVEKVEIAKCVLCGKPVFTYSEDEILDDAGVIEMSFGYGSGRDTNSGKGYIHDNCSGILDQTIFKVRLDWSYPNPIVLKSENQQ